MDYAPPRRRRRNLRLPGFDYARPGAYFVTICTHDRGNLFGEIVDGALRPSEAGDCVLEVWEEIPQHTAGVEVDAFVVMPNHVHGIVKITTDPPVDAGLVRPSDRHRAGPGARTLGAIVGGFKSSASRRINAARGTPGALVWQRGYHDHVIRGDVALERIRRYIAENPMRWAEDPENPARGRPPRSR